MRQQSNAGSTGGIAGTARGLAWAGRYLLMLIAVSLVTMPITEHLWTWDRFLRGGEDFELSALLVLSVLCLVLVLTKQCQQRVQSSLTTGWVAALQFMKRVALGIGLAGEVLVLAAAPGSDPATGRNGFPLQI